MKLIPVTLVLAALLVATRSNSTQSQDDVRDKLLGKWVAISGEVDGQEIPDDDLLPMSVTFTKDELKTAPSELLIAKSPTDPKPKAIDVSDYGMKCKLDATKTPHWLDVKIGTKNTGTKNETPIYNQCIFRLEDDLLTISWGEQQRPRSLRSRRGNEYASITYCREAAVQKK